MHTSDHSLVCNLAALVVLWGLGLLCQSHGTNRSLATDYMWKLCGQVISFCMCSHKQLSLACFQMATLAKSLRPGRSHGAVHFGLVLVLLTGRQFYSNAAEPQPQPLLYARFPTPLEPGAVRLAVLQPPAAIRAAAYQAADAVAQALVQAGASKLHQMLVSTWYSVYGEAMPSAYPALHPASSWPSLFCALSQHSLHHRRKDVDKGAEGH